MKKIGSGLLIILILIFGYIAYNYISYRTKNAVSDAAFIKTDTLLDLGFKVSGKVVKLVKEEGDEVKKGELLAKIDDKDFKIALKKIQKEIESLNLKIEALKKKWQRTKNELDIDKKVAQNRIASMKQKVLALNFKISANLQNLNKLSLDEKRFKKLLKENLISKNEYEKIKTQKEFLKNLIEAQKKELLSTDFELKNLKERLNLSYVKRRVLKELDLEIKSLVKRKEALQKSEEDIKNKIIYCNLYSPIEGVVAKKFVNISKVVDKGYPIYSVVDTKDLHIEVLLSEKKLKGVKVGNKVKIKIEAYPDRRYYGEVEKILPASAATFSLVPRDIASGEFTKLDQRFTVRIKLLNPDSFLRVGMGATVAIQRQ
jgi:membrane fusion protein (multidrug efflux system)